MLLWLVIFGLGLAIYFYIYKPHQCWKEKNVVYIKPWPIVGNMWGFIGRGLSLQEWLQTVYDKYDTRYFGFYQFLEPILLVKDLDLIKQIGIKDFEYFTDHKHFFAETREPVVSLNLFSIKGEPWKKMRATLSPAFTGSKMRSMFNLMLDCSEQFTNFFEEAAIPGKPQVLQMKDIFTRFSNDVIATCAFGIEVNSLKDRNNEFYLRGQEVCNFGGSRASKFIGFMMAPELMNFFNIRIYNDDLMNFFRNLVKTTMEVREKNNIYRPDMIHLLMEARKGNLKHEDKSNIEDTGFATTKESDIGMANNTTTKLSDDDIAAQVLLFFIAGFETSSTSLIFLAYELAVNEDIQVKVQNEIDDAMIACKGKLNYDVVLKLKYLDMVISESLRKWPPIFYINRATVKPYTIKPKHLNEKPVHLDKNTAVWFPTFCIQRNPKIFPNPSKFDPERFNDENKKNIDIGSYLSFGIGPRNCIASRFALLEIKALIVKLLWKFDFVVVKETHVPVKIDKKQLFLASEDGIMLGLKKRNT